MSASDDKRKARAALADARKNMAILTEARASAEAALLPRIHDQITELQRKIEHLELHCSAAYRDVHSRRHDGNYIQSHGHKAAGYR